MLPLQGGTGSIPGREIKILYAAMWSKKKKKESVLIVIQIIFLRGCLKKQANKKQKVFNQEFNSIKPFRDSFSNIIFVQILFKKNSRIDE